MIESRYPNYDVSAHQAEWDENTRRVIEQRMQPPGELQFFTQPEAAALTAALGRLLGENDDMLIAKVLEHIDRMLAEGTGEGYRPEHRPGDKKFWRTGVETLGSDFALKTPPQQDAYLSGMQGQPFFKALLKEAVTAYCSLPPVWSFMGYGGPAFPRGYVRIELGLTDPWEAKQNAE